LVAIFDSCHSGTVLDLPFTYRSNGEYQGEGLNPLGGQKAQIDIGKAFLKAGMSYLKGDKAAFKSFGTSVYEGVKCHVLMKENPVNEANSSPADVVQLSGCKDDQTSADAAIAGKSTGAMSWALLAALNKHPQGITLIELLHAVRTIMEQKQFTQIPQMSTSHKMDPASKFEL